MQQQVEENDQLNYSCYYIVFTPNMFTPFFLINFIFVSRIKGNDAQITGESNDDAALNDRSSLFYFEDQDENDDNPEFRERETEYYTDGKGASSSQPFALQNLFNFSNSSSVSNRPRMDSTIALGVEMEEVVQSYENEKKRHKEVNDSGREKGLHVVTEKNEF